VREGVSALLSAADDVELVATVADPATLLDAVAEHHPDAVLTDTRMPPTYTTEGIDAAKRIRAGHPSTGVVVLSLYVEEDYALDLLSDGVAGLGYLLKERVSERDELVRAPVRRRTGWFRPRPEGRRGTARPEVAGVAVAVARPDRPRTRGAAGDVSRPEQLGDGQGAVLERAGVEKHIGSVFQKLGPSTSPMSTVASWRSSPFSKRPADQGRGSLPARTSGGVSRTVRVVSPMSPPAGAA
jgi:CheY-like chemotaxis protein